jgi:uncharacterized protein
VISSHSWANDVVYQRIYQLDGVIAPRTAPPTGSSTEWARHRDWADEHGPRGLPFGIGYGADTNGLGLTAGPRSDPAQPVDYDEGWQAPIGDVTIGQHTSGVRTYDITEDGVAHYGLFADWFHELRALSREKSRPPALEAAPRAAHRGHAGRPRPTCSCGSARCTAATTASTTSPTQLEDLHALLGLNVEGFLTAAGQPLDRDGAAYVYCVEGEDGSRTVIGTVAALLLTLGLVGTPATADEHDQPTQVQTYVTMSDGVQIAISVRFPDGFYDDPDRTWPTIFQMDGYAGGGGSINPASYRNSYVTLYASVRGTGCSGGRFDLFDRRHAEDGKEIIDGWIAEQPWSNGRVGIVGYSYPGLTGFLVASTQPESVKAIALGGLIDDLYRGLVYMGGVANHGFPVYWPGAFRPAVEILGNAGRYAGETFSGDPACAANIASRPPQDPFESPFTRGSTQLEDGPWWQMRAPTTWVDRINAPIHITHHYQDEQTGPRGGHTLWERVSEDVPKRLVMTNGRHGTTGAENTDRLNWLDCWLLHDGVPGLCNPDVTDERQRVRIHFETTGNQSTNPPLVSSDFPLPETAWTEYHLRADGALTEEAPGAGEGSSTYVSLPRGRQPGAYTMNPLTASSGPDELTYTLEFDEATALAGPITATLWASSISPETELFVTLIDQFPDGRYEYLQRGMLRTSHRAVDELRSERIAHGPYAGTIYRPHRPHTNPELLTPGEATEHLVEVFPLGHVFREGHRLVVKISAPPTTDPVSELYAYDAAVAGSVIEIHHDAEHPSRLLLPVLAELPPVGDERPGCGAQSGLRCVDPAL